MFGFVAASVVPLPLVTLNASTNFNQNRATLNATVDGQGLLTSVEAQYSGDGGTTWSAYSPTVPSTLYASTSVYVNVTGLVSATPYIVRARATNAKGVTTVQNSNGNFQTWSLQTFTQTTAGSFSVEVPSITPTGSNAIAPTILEVAVYGGGGGANYAGGGGGGYRLVASKSSSVTGTQNVTGTVGSGGAAGNGGSGAGGATSGGSSSLTIGDTTYTANGGGNGVHVGTCGAPSGTGGSAGSGDNTAFGGGNNTYGYYYISDYVFVCQTYNKLGQCTGGYYDYNQPIYSWDCGYYAGGGGGGAGGAGTNAATQSTNSHIGGNGGAGYDSGYGLRGGAGGGGVGTQGNGTTGAAGGSSGTIVGTGGAQYGAGVAGGVTFKYYGP